MMQINATWGISMPLQENPPFAWSNYDSKGIRNWHKALGGFNVCIPPNESQSWNLDYIMTSPSIHHPPPQPAYPRKVACCRSRRLERCRICWGRLCARLAIALPEMDFRWCLFRSFYCIPPPALPMCCSKRSQCVPAIARGRRDGGWEEVPWVQVEGVRCEG